MADILDLIKSRRNIKRYLPKFVSWDYLSKIIDAARHAPSCGNIQNWKFIIVLEPGQKQKLAEAAHEQYDLALAGALIVICAEPEKAERYYGERGEKLFCIQNCAAAAQNMLLEAHSLGLGATWVGGFNEDAVKSVCGIPPEASPQVIVAIGYPQELPKKPPKYPLETLVYFGKWRNKFRDLDKYMGDIASILERKAFAAKDKTKFLVGKVKEKISRK